MSATPSSICWEELSSCFAQLLELPPAERSARLVALTAERPDLGRELAAMLAAEDDSQALSVEAAFAADTLSGATDVRAVELSLDRLRAVKPGEQLGPYRLLELVARGGMGEVFLAERADGNFEQKVAIKLMRPGLDTVDLVSRFELERDLLARLTHPSVVPLLDGGTTAEGRPYLVLQYVDGKPITQHCAERELDRRARVRLFYRLSRAVAYAHSHLVVHRDLKPSNILVTSEGEVRLLDFGIAKLLSGDRPRAEMTRAELVPMTPERAAPEQRRLEPITTATDVWALGLLLAELLTGELPAGAEEGKPQLQGLAFTLGDRDLAAILTQALRVEPERRYTTAGELADDVERWLSREPVKARPDSFGYRLNRFVARHRGAVTVGSAALVAVVLLALFSAWQSWRMARIQSRAAQESARAAEALEVLADLLGSADPTVTAQGGKANDQLLRLAEARADRLDEQPEMQARLRHKLGEIQYQRGDIQRALELFRLAYEAESRRLDEADPRLLRWRLDYAQLLHSNGRLEESRGEVAEVERLVAEHRLIESDPELQAMVWVRRGAHQPGAAGEELVTRGIALLRREVSDPVQIGAALTVLANRRQMVGDREGARRLWEESVALQLPVFGEDDPRILASQSSIAEFLPEAAERVARHRDILRRRVRVLGEKSQGVANSWRFLGSALAAQGEWIEAIDAFRKSRELWEELGAPTHAWALLAQRQLAWALGQSGQRQASLAAYDELVRRLDAAPNPPRNAATYREEREAAAAAALGGE